MPKIVVTGHDGGKAVVAKNFERPVAAFETMPAFSATLVWSTGQRFQLPFDTNSFSDERDTVLPAEGEINLMIVTYPSADTPVPEGFDPAAFGAEMLARLPGLAERFEENGMHCTDTIDFGIILSGELQLRLDDEIVSLNAGDIVVQNGTRHGWTNPGSEPTTVAFTMIGARRA
ncbi:MAG: cupin domain-containing protein [Thioclava marina]|uniref:cupin domain-containing protein n=1 Tax=Thioclava marina TaxID=1915077 RepID=UPI00199296F3|nr:cupin domain-containing protein [Thioclava marina]MBC7143912.1 cupin domain-containing protein [Thioclava marina]